MIVYIVVIIGWQPSFAQRSDAIISNHFLSILIDSCVNKAKVEESEQKAVEFSKKVRLMLVIIVKLIIHSQYIFYLLSLCEAL